MLKGATSLCKRTKWIKISFWILILFLGQLVQNNLTAKYCSDNGVQLAFPPAVLIGIVAVGAIAGVAGKKAKAAKDKKVLMEKQKAEMYKKVFAVVAEKERRRQEKDKSNKIKIVIVVVAVVLMIIIGTILYRKNKK